MALNWDRARKQALEIDKKYNTARSVTPGASSLRPWNKQVYRRCKYNAEKDGYSAAQCRHAHGGPGAAGPGDGREPGVEQPDAVHP